MDEDTVMSGFLIEETFARMCREFLHSLEHFRPHLLNKGGYSRPRTDIPPEQMPKQYRGLQREPMQGWLEALHGSGVVEPTEQELAASLFLTELEEAGKAGDDFIFALEDAREVLRRIPPPVEREIIWARRMDGNDEPPAGAVLLGYETNTFYPPTCDSPIADWMFFNYSLRRDEEGLQFKAYHGKLNQWGLFDSPQEAERYLEAYLSFLPADGDEHYYRYHTAEVRAIADNASR